MEKTESRKHTRTKVNVPNQGEVFVLTPDILQKLGISLGDIATAQQPNQIPETKRDTKKNRTTKDKNKTNVSSSKSFHNKINSQKKSIKRDKFKTSDDKSSPLLEKALTSKTFLNTSSLNSSCEINSNVKETHNDAIPVSSSVLNNVNDTDSTTSIVETAMLMKKSVFLSPSFCNTLHYESTQEASTDVPAELILPEDIGIKENDLVDNVKEIAILNESLDFSDSTPVQILNNSYPVSAKDKFIEIDEDIPLSKLRMSLQKTKNNTISETIVPISADNINDNLKEQTFRNSKGKNYNVNVLVSKNMISVDLEPVYVESNKDKSKNNYEISDISEKESLDTSQYKAGWNLSATSKINGECLMKTINDEVPLDDSTILEMEDVDHYDEEYTLDNNNSNQGMAPARDIQDGQKNTSKISIISEEIIDSSVLKEIKIPCSRTKFHLTPLSIETKISRDTSCKSGGIPGISEKPNVERNLNTDLKYKNDLSENKVEESNSSEDISSKKGISKKPKLEYNLNTDTNYQNSLSENKIVEAKISCDSSSNSVDISSKKHMSRKSNVKFNLNTETNCENGISENKIRETKISKDVSHNSEDICSKKIISKKAHVKQILITESNNKNSISEKKVEKTKISEDTNCVDAGNKTDISGKPNVKHNLNTNSNDKNSVSEKKVKEIANYLSQIFKSGNSEQNVRNEKKFTLNSKRNKNNSKVCVQGVEKPGGGESNQIDLYKHKIIKTYTHSRKIKNSKKDTNIDYIRNFNLKFPPAIIDCKDVSSDSNNILQNWCVCSDFGKFDVYYQNEPYEHIHFWYHQNIMSKPEIIYSIYNEDCFNKDKPDSNNQTLETDTEERECTIICWCNTVIYDDKAADHVTDPDYLINQGHKKNARILFKEMKASAAPSSSDAAICNLKIDKNVETTTTTRRNSWSTDIHELNKPSAEDLHSLSHTYTQAHCLNFDTANMAKQRVTRNSMSIKEDNNDVKDNPTSDIAPHSITRRKSIRLSSNESINVGYSITQAIECPFTSTSKKSSGIEVGKIVKRTRNTTSAEVVDTKTRNKDIISTNVSEINRTKIEKEALSKTDTKTCHPIEIEQNTKTLSVNKVGHRLRSPKSTSVEVVEKNVYNQREQQINLKCNEALNGPIILNVSNSSSINKKSVSVAKNPVKRTRCSTSVEVTDNNQLEDKINSEIETRNKSVSQCEASSISAPEKLSVGDMDKPVRRTRNSTSAEVLNKSVNKVNKLEQSIKPKTSKEIVNQVLDASFKPTITKAPAVDKDKSTKHTRNSTSLEVRYTMTEKNSDQTLDPSIYSSVSEIIEKTGMVDAKFTSNKTELRKRPRNSVTIEAAINHNTPSKSTESHSCKPGRTSQRKSSTADNSDSSTKRVRQRTETVEFVSLLPAQNVNMHIKQEIKTEPVSEHTTEDVDSLDEPSVSGISELQNDSLITCGTCNETVLDESWQQHLKSHNYLTWKATEQPLDLNDREKIKQYLHYVCRNQGGLYCSKCGIMRKYPKAYLHHIDSCDGKTTVNLESSTVSAMDTTQESITDTNDSLVKSKRTKRKKIDEVVKCGVCKEDVFNSNWIEHIRIKHQYMAKREGEIPLDQNDEEEVREHLYKISRDNGGLICNLCGTNRRYVKVYLGHIKVCQGVKEDDKEDDSLVKSEVICGVCKLEVSTKQWYKHIQSEHRYMAWIEGEPPLNVNDQQQVLQHLQNIAKKAGRLYCWVCNESRKIAKVYMQHVTICEESGFSGKPAESNPNLTPDQFECGVCHEIGKKSEWKNHAMSNHYNVAWMVGQAPLNIKNFYAVAKYLKEYQSKQGSFSCKICGLTRSSHYGFYAHILTCGKSDDEVEQLMNLCDICNKKYVCIYKNQHMAAHRDAELKKERREREEEIKKEKEEQEKEQALPNGKRRAAAKAQKVLEELITDDDDGPPTVKRRRISDSDDSLKMEDDANESDSPESEVDSNLSDEENDISQVRNRKAPLPKLQRLPFKIENASKYLKQSYLEHKKIHLTNDCLYNEWRHTELKSVSVASKYIPTVNISCKLKFYGGEWSTLKRFESKKNDKAFVLFAGGCIQCMSWVPEDPNSDDNFYLSIATHRGPDVPRYNKDKISVHPGLIQIWSYGDFRSTPVLALGLAHNFGTVWAMDWCASGARDVVPSDCSDKTTLRLGLLAVACSSGKVYIISVPHPPDVNNGEIIICEAHPVVELRLNYNSKSKFQATSICWTSQKGHGTVLVGYADGTTALYDLNTTSPLLTERSPDTNLTIIYPFLEKKTENAPISALAVTPTLDSSRTFGSVCSGGATGVSVWSGEAPAAWLRTTLAARTAANAVHWPAHRLLAEIAVSGKVINEIDWYGGRRIGPMSESASCARCAATVVAAPPEVRLVRSHPAYPEIKKRVIATLQMVPINMKLPLKKMKDDNAVVLQPVTYKDAVGIYGLEFKMISKKDRKSSAEIEQRADRFPLSEVTAASFCPSDRYHHRIALATHAGIVFVFNACN